VWRHIAGQSRVQARNEFGGGWARGFSESRPLAGSGRSGDVIIVSSLGPTIRDGLVPPIEPKDNLDSQCETSHSLSSMDKGRHFSSFGPASAPSLDWKRPLSTYRADRDPHFKASAHRQTTRRSTSGPFIPANSASTLCRTPV